MLRLVAFLVAITAAAFALTWLGKHPGEIAIDWQGHVITTTVFRAVILALSTMALSVFAWSILRRIWRGPAAVGHFMNQRRERRGLDAISSGLIAIGSGDRALATRAAVQARKALPNQPLTHILRAQAAQLSGDRATARRIFEAMLQSPDTEQLGLRGLFLEAGHEGETVAARHYAERALALNPRLEWPVEALFDLQVRATDWDGALDTLAIGRRQGTIDKQLGDRRRAVILTAQAQASEDHRIDLAQALATEAHGLAPDLVPAAAIAGRTLAARGATGKAARILQRTWKLNPHPDLAAAYAFARPGDSTSDRLTRIRQLAALTPSDNEGPIALAEAAMAAKSYDEARMALAPLLDHRLTQRVAKLMARLESEQHGNAGGVREWIARAVNAPLDPAWTADGVVAERWSPLSPKTQTFDAFQWRVPATTHDGPANELLAARMDELIALGARHYALPAEPMSAVAAPTTQTPADIKPATAANGHRKPVAAAPAPGNAWADIAAAAADTSARTPARPAAPAVSRDAARAAKTVDDFIDDAVIVTEPTARSADKSPAARTMTVDRGVALEAAARGVALEQQGAGRAGTGNGAARAGTAGDPDREPVEIETGPTAAIKPARRS